MQVTTALLRNLRPPAGCIRVGMPLLAWLGFFAMVPLSTLADPVFWEREISAALDSRDSCYREAGINGSQFQHLSAAPGKIRTEVQDTAIPWYCFLKGLASGDNVNVAAGWFARAIAATEKDPGKLWVLAVEFDRCEMPAWEEKCLKKLELVFLTSGAMSAPVIAQQLLYRASASRASGNGGNVEYYSGWAQRFDRRCLWPVVFSMERNGLLDLAKAADLLRDLSGSFSASWETQLVCVRALFRWFSLVVEFLIAGILLGLAVRCAPTALHLLSERFPDILNARGKLVLAIAAVGSVAFLGMLPFTWVCFFVLWRRFG